MVRGWWSSYCLIGGQHCTSSSEGSFRGAFGISHSKFKQLKILHHTCIRNLTRNVPNNNLYLADRSQEQNVTQRSIPSQKPKAKRCFMYVFVGRHFVNKSAGFSVPARCLTLTLLIFICSCNQRRRISICRDLRCKPSAYSNWRAELESDSNMIWMGSGSETSLIE